MSTSFLAIYRGRTVADAKLVAVSADPQIVSEVAARLLKHPDEAEDSEDDPVLAAVERGRRRALRLVSRETAPSPAVPAQIVP